MERCIRVLIADDRACPRKGLRAVFALRPWIEVVAEASDGRQAVELVAECQPDVVLMDAHMPGMDGLEATRLIKSNWPEVRVVMLTLYDYNGLEAMAAGADAFVVKGGPTEELVNVLSGDPPPARPRQPKHPRPVQGKACGPILLAAMVSFAA
jgi:DNA-binding NarL/FixJ family response regulator